MDDLTKLGQTAERSKLLQELFNQSGWRLAQETIEEVWYEGFNELRQSNGNMSSVLMADTKMKTVEDLLHKLGLQVAWGNKAKTQYDKLVGKLKQGG